MQSGEKRFARRLASHLEDDYLCWYETGIGLRPRYTDFVILHPLRGLLLIEVKDRREESIKAASRDTFDLLTSAGLKRVQNPINQARQCLYQLKEHLERDPQLVYQTGDHKGKLIMPYGFGVVFTRLSRQQFERMGLGQVIPELQVVCQDEMTETTEVEEFQKRLWDMFPYCFNSVLTQPQIDRVRWHMFPEIRMQPQPELNLPSEGSDSPFDIPDIVKVMDLKQERLARGLGSGHRVIHGVAGSGKTMILGYRCLHLARLLHKPILVLCYNVVLAARLRSLIQDHGLDGKINVYSIHSWANTILKTYNIRPPKFDQGNFDAAIELLIDQVSKGQIPRAQYGAVLIDEGHDFRKEWLRLIVDMVDPDTNSLLLLYDDTQSIYKKSAGLGFSLKEVGIEAQGRTTILKLNYRNTEQILKFAFDFIDDFLSPTDGDQDGVPIIQPDTTGRRGSLPVMKSFESFDGEARYIASTFRKLHEQRDLPWSDMCVLYCHNWMGKSVTDALREFGIPFAWLRDSQSKRQFSSGEESVKVITMHSSKGLEFPTVATCGIGYLGSNEERQLEEAKLLYVAMTRATENLLITSSKASPFSAKLQDMLEKHKNGLAA